MLLRYLVSNWVRQSAHQTLRDVAAQVKDASEPGTTAEGTAPPPPPAEVVVAFALRAEAGGLVDLLANGVSSRCASFVEHTGELGDRRIAVMETGVGQTAAHQAVRDAIALHQPSWVVSAGFAGALHPDLRRGHIIMPKEIVDEHGQRLDVGLGIDDETVAATPSLHSGRLLTVDKLVRHAKQRRELAEQHAALACDMESFAVADVCREAKVRFLSVRVISDSVDDQLPEEVERLLEQDTVASRLGAATGAIFNRPSSIKDMWNLKEQAIKASDRLARFLTQTLARLPA